MRPVVVTLGCAATLALSLSDAHAQAAMTLAEARALAVAPQDVFLDVLINGAPTRMVARFRLRDGRLHASAAELRQIGIRVDDAPANPSSAMAADIALDALPGLSYRYLPASQQVHLVADDARRLPTVIDPNERPRPRVTPGTGLVVNYDVYAQPDANARLGISSEQRVFTPGGVFVNTMFATFDRERQGVTRLDTTWTRADPDRLTTLQMGDTISGALAWSRAVRLGGLQFRRNFALRPDLITYPVATLGATAAVPSTVDLYVNNVRQYSGQVPSGPFVLNNAPAITGAGQAVIVVRDVLGRDVATSIPLYVDTRLLRPGFVDYAVEAGFLRERYGADSFAYDRRPAGSGTARYGVNDALTLEGHAETMPGTVVAGGGALVRLGAAGVVNASAAGSAGRGAGGLFSLGYQLRTPRLTFDAQGSRVAGAFTDLAARAGAPFPRVLYRATLAVPVARTGNVALSAIRIDDPLGGTSRIGTVAYTAQISTRASLAVSAYRDFARSRVSGFLLTLSAMLGTATSGSVSAGTDGGKASFYANAQRTPDYGGGWGWQVQGAQGGGVQRAAAQASYRGAHGEVLAAVQQVDGRASTALTATGSLVAMDGTVMAARRINESFALVSTNGVRDVPVLMENRRIGATDGGGYFLVPDLMPYDANKVAIDPLALPANTRLSATALRVAPAWRSGALAMFQVEPFQGGQVVLVDEHGQPLPAGTPVTRLESGARAVIGYDGLVFFDTLGDSNTLRAELPAGACRASVRFHGTGASIPMLGRVICEPEAP